MLSIGRNPRQPCGLSPVVVAESADGDLRQAPVSNQSSYFQGSLVLLALRSPAVIIAGPVWCGKPLASP